MNGLYTYEKLAKNAKKSNEWLDEITKDPSKAKAYIEALEDEIRGSYSEYDIASILIQYPSQHFRWDLRFTESDALALLLETVPELWEPISKEIDIIEVLDPRGIKQVCKNRSNKERLIALKDELNDKQLAALLEV